jgi:23S rRNA pseudouridine955/2504/2580 synthase/23S rRNA pseudouridine1911/1915/1917 synthase
MGKADIQQLILQVLYDDARLVAVAKPAGLATIPGRAETTCAQYLIAGQLKLPVKGDADPRIRVVHRLDKDTSGVLLFAKDIDTQRHLSHLFQNNAIRKEYLALVNGRPGADEGEIDAPIGVDRARPDRMRVDKRGRPALTRWKIEEAFRGLTLLRCFPKTGKTHQIRVHLLSIGHPLAIDLLYGPPLEVQADAEGEGQQPGLLLSRFKRSYRLGKFKQERPLISRLTLHAERIGFEHPDKGPMEIVCPLPKDFQATLNMLRKYARA